jgi:hypothetical protein
VADIGNATAAAELKIATTAGDGAVILKGGVLTLSGSPGVGAQFSDALTSLTEPGDGVLTVENNNLTTKINDLNKSIAGINAIAAQMEVALVEQFSALESIIASSQTTSQELQAILGGTNTGSNSVGSLQSILGNNTAGSSSGPTGGGSSGGTPSTQGTGGSGTGANPGSSGNPTG